MDTVETAPASDNAFPFDPTDPAFTADPYPIYDSIREERPAIATAMGTVVLSRHADCVHLLHHPETSNDQRKSKFADAYKEGGFFEEDAQPSFLFLDPPDHTRLRGLVAQAFTPRRVRDLIPRIQEIVDELIDAKLAAGGMDVIEDLAYPLPIRVICEILGVPTADTAKFAGWSRKIGRALDPDFMIPPEVRVEMQEANDALSAYFDELIERRRTEPGEDLISALLAAEQEGDKLSHQEVMSTIGLLFIAGHETTVNLIGNGVLQFGRYPGQLDRLRDDDTLGRTAVEEVLRFDPPVQMTGRLAMTEFTFHGVTIQPGEQGLCLIGGANRDPREFGETAQTFDISRNPNNNIAFGAGIHYCLGAPLAKLEGQVAFTTLARKVRNLEVATDKPAYKENLVLRGLQELPVVFQPVG